MSDLTTATFLFTDLVGSTELRTSLGEEAADALQADHDRLLRQALAQSGGVEVKTFGDGLMAVFPSAVDAVACARRIQEAIADRNRSADPPALALRIGINSGEVAKEEGDYTGMPVVAARRVCDLAQGGQILVTGLVRSLVGSRGGFDFSWMGATPLKGLAAPVELWELGSREEAQPSEVPGDGEIPFPAVLTRPAEAVLVGREGDLSRLDEAYRRALGAERQVVLVAGEPGIGKSALTAVWTRGAADEGAVVLAGRCPSESVTSYQPFVEVVRQVVLARPSLIRQIGPGAAELLRLVPDQTTLLPATPRLQAEPGTERYLLFEAFVTLVHRLAEERPVVLLLDDLHWADAPSLALLEYLARHQDQARVLVVATYRDTELSRSHPLARLLADLRRERRFERLQLGGLDASQVRDLITGRVGRPLPLAVVASIHAETEGNPFFVEEVVAHLIDVGAIDPFGHWQAELAVEELGIPEGVREVIGRRLERLDEPTNRTLTVAAVIGREFDLDLLEAVTEDPLQLVEDQVDQAVAAGLLVDTAGYLGRFAFSHALIRQTLYEEMPPTRRARTHHRVGEALMAAGAPAGELAHHWSAAHDLPRALQASITAADASEQVYAFDDARRHLDLALELWDMVPNPHELTGIDRVELLRRAAEMWYLVNDDAQALELIAQALAGVDPSLDPVRAGVLSERHARYLWVAGRGGPALAAGHEAVRRIPAHPPSEERAKALASVAGLLMLASRFTESRDYAVEAIEVARSVGARKVEGHALTTLGTIEGASAEVEEGIAHIKEGRRISEEEQAIDDLLRSQVNLSSILDQAGRLREAADEALAGMALATRYGLHAKYGTFQLGNAAGSLIRLGEWEEAEGMLAGQPPQEPAAVAAMSLLIQRLALAIGRGRFAEAQRLAAELFERSRETIDPQFVAPIHGLSAELAYWEGRLEDSLRLAEEGIKLVEGSQDWFYSVPLHAAGLRAVADLTRADSQRAPMWRESGHRLAERLAFAVEVSPDIGAHRAVARAELARAGGVDDPESWAEAARLWLAIPQPYEAAYAQWRQAEALLDRNRPKEAIEVVETALRVVTELGAHPLQERLEQTAHQLQETSSPSS